MARKNSNTETTTTNATTTTTQETEAKKRTTRAKAQVPAEIKPEPKPEPIPERTIDFSPMGKVNGWVSSRQRTIKRMEDMKAYAAMFAGLCFFAGVWFGQWIVQIERILH